MKPPRLELPVAEAFLRELGAPRVLCAIHPDTGQIKAATPRDRQSLRGFLTTFAAWNLYFAVNRTRRPMTTKPKKIDVRFFDFVHVDIDPPTDVADLEAWQQATRATVKACAFPPSFLWCSGNGIQALWRIREPILLDSPAAIALCERRNDGVARLFEDGDTTTWNIDRVLRIPGTTNFPNATKRAAGRIARKTGNVEVL